MESTDLEELSTRTGVPVGELESWRAKGLIGAGDRTVEMDAERARLIHFLVGCGFDLDSIASADRQDPGLFDRFIPLLYPWSPLPSYSLGEVADRSGVDLALIHRLWEAAGFAEQRDAWSDDDVEAARALATAIDAGLPEAALIQIIRVYADSLSRVAEAEVRLFHFYVHEQLRAFGLSGTELNEATERASSQLQALVEPAVLYFHRKGWQRATRDDLALHVAHEAGLAQPTDVPGALRAAVLFTDLARFTPLTDTMGDAAAADVVERFSTIVRNATNRWHGRVIKQIGDEFMLVFHDPGAALACALDIDERASNEANFPAVRSGAHWGELLYREGDYVGSTVNIAARLAAQAQAHELLTTEILAATATDIPQSDCASLGARTLKGVTEDVEVFAIRRTARAAHERLLDPVCGMEMAADQVVARLEIGDAIRAFCSDECLQRYVADPDRYPTA